MIPRTHYGRKKGGKVSKKPQVGKRPKAGEGTQAVPIQEDLSKAKRQHKNRSVEKAKAEGGLFYNVGQTSPVMESGFIGLSNDFLEIDDNCTMSHNHSPVKTLEDE